MSSFFRLRGFHQLDGFDLSGIRTIRRVSIILTATLHAVSISHQVSKLKYDENTIKKCLSKR